MLWGAHIRGSSISFGYEKWHGDVDSKTRVKTKILGRKNVCRHFAALNQWLSKTTYIPLRWFWAIGGGGKLYGLQRPDKWSEWMTSRARSGRASHSRRAPAEEEVSLGAPRLLPWERQPRICPHLRNLLSVSLEIEVFTLNFTEIFISALWAKREIQRSQIWAPRNVWPAWAFVFITAI